MWLDVFGSALREDFEPDRSDIHFLMDFGPVPPLGQAGCVDLVMVGALMNRCVRDEVNRSKQQL